MKKHYSRVDLVFTVFLVASLLLGSWLIPTVHASLNGKASEPTQALRVAIYPRDIKLYLGETETFQAILYDGSEPFSYQWFSNGTFIGSDATVTFGFTELCYYTILSVEVTDALGNMGFASTFVYDPAAISSTVFEPGSGVETASYTIFAEGSTYYAKNGSTGAIQYSGTNASQLIENTIGDLGTYGGQILFHESVYNLTVNNAITVDKPVTFRGEGQQASRIIGGNNVFFNVTSAYVEFNDLWFCGSNETGYTSQIGIFVSGVNNIKIKNCIFDGLYRAIVFSGICFYNEIDSCFFYDAVDTFIYANNRLNIIISNIQASVPSATSFLDVAQVDTIRISSSLISGVFTSEVLRFRAYYGGASLFSNSDFENNLGSAPSVRIEGSDVNANRFYFFGNCYLGGGGGTSYVAVLNRTNFVTFDTCEFTGSYRGIQFVGSNNNTKFTDSVFQTTDVPIAASNDAVIRQLQVIGSSYEGSYTFINFANLADANQTNIIVEDNSIPNSNIQLVNTNTKTSGTTEASNDDWIAFGITFHASPQVILLTVNENDSAYAAQVCAGSANTTHFQLYLYDIVAAGAEASDQTIMWYAEYKP